MQIAISIIVLALCGGFLWWFRRNEAAKRIKSNDEEEREKAAKATAQEFINARTLGEKCLYTIDDMIIAAVQIEGLSIELFSNAEQEVIKRNLSSRLSSVKYPYKYIAVSRPVDISRALCDYEQLKNDATGGRRKLIKAEMDELAGMVMSGETLERQYYIIIWESTKREDERGIVARAEELAKIYNENRIKASVVDSRGLVRLCNLVNIPAYAHLENTDVDEKISVLKAR